MQHLEEEQKQYFFDLLSRTQHLWKNKVRGRIYSFEHAIYLKHYHPIVSRPRYVSEEQKKIIKQEV